jgi:formylglycine-generating enzyme required for sulfatase activity
MGLPDGEDLSVGIPLLPESAGFYRISFHEASVQTDRMALVPDGVFQMGDAYNEPTFVNDVPVHFVFVRDFLIDRFEVTNDSMMTVMQWAYDQGIVEATASTVVTSEGAGEELLDLDGMDGSIPKIHLQFLDGVFTVTPGYEDHPCTGVTWYGAQAYCNYLSDIEGLERCIDFLDWSCDFEKEGYRLPTEAEWEKAARGGLTGHYYPWESLGGSASQHIDRSKANYTNSTYFADPRYVRTTPVGYFNGSQYHAGTDMKNGYGLYDMAGNVWEWCWDYYQADWYSNPSAAEDNVRGPLGPLPTRIIRGGGWGHNDPIRMRCANRYKGFGLTYTSTVVGFRCARSL